MAAASNKKHTVLLTLHPMSINVALFRVRKNLNQKK
jgi:hypothetical protein